MLGSCAKVPMKHATYFVDYKEAGKGRVFISEANSVSFEYEPLGSVIVEEISGYKPKVKHRDLEKEQKLEPLYIGPSSDYVVEDDDDSKYANANAQSALNYAVDEVIRMGGNGLINVKISTYYPEKSNRRVVAVYGMAIKR